MDALKNFLLFGARVVYSKFVNFVVLLQFEIGMDRKHMKFRKGKKIYYWESAKKRDERVWAECRRIFKVPNINWRRICCYVFAIVIAYLVCRWMLTVSPVKKELLAEQEKNFELLSKLFPCSSLLLNDVSKYSGCEPKTCGRFVMDNFISQSQVDALSNMMKRAFSYGTSSGGSSTLDVYTGAMSKGPNFVNIYKLEKAEILFEEDEIETYKLVCEMIQKAITQLFGLRLDKVYLTRPTFFTRLSNLPAVTIHDVYWVNVVDLLTHPSFHYVAVLYLNDFGEDFSGGQLNFVDNQNVTSVLEPKKGRLVMYSGGQENQHSISEVTSGIRYSLTIAFTCDESKKILHPFDNPYFNK